MIVTQRLKNNLSFFMHTLIMHNKLVSTILFTFFLKHILYVLMFMFSIQSKHDFVDAVFHSY